MVVLELEGANNMLGSGPNQYLQPDYLSPLSSPLDSKVSPLALLAKTCSQIGADEGPSKSLFESSKRKLSTCSESSVKSESSESSSKDTLVVNNNNNNKESSSNSSGSSGNSSIRSKNGSSSVPPFTTNSPPKSGGGKISPLLSPTSVSPAFKPYEIPSKRESEKNEKSGVKQSSSSGKHSSSSRSSTNCSPKVKTPNPRSLSPQEKEISVTDTKNSKVSSVSSASVDAPKSSSSEHGASPIIRPGLEVLQQGQLGASAAAIAEYHRKLSALSSLSGYPQGFDPLNPAFRPPFMCPPHQSYPISLGSPYVSYSRVKNASGTESIVPVCKDPYCTGCQYGGGVHHGAASMAGGGGSGAERMNGMNGLMAAAAAAAAAAGFPPSLTGVPSPATSSNVGNSSGICLAGCMTPCDHPKLPQSSLPHLFPPGLASSLSSVYPSSLLSQHAAASAAANSTAQQNAQRPYVCNWIVGDNYCGKRFPSSEELLQHLRTHTNSSTSSSSASTAVSESSAFAAAMLQQQQNSLYSASLLNPAMAAAAAAMHRTYPTPPLSPLSSRYHPYATPGKTSLGSSLVPPPPFGSYYPYSTLYGQRLLGPSSVHP